MSKRIIDTTMLTEVWFQKLSPIAKNFWHYLNLACDAAGVWPVNMELASFTIGEPITEADMIKELGCKIEPNFKSADPRYASKPLWFLPGFVMSQLKYLSRSCPLHNATFRALDAHGLTDRVGGLLPRTKP